MTPGKITKPGAIVLRPLDSTHTMTNTTTNTTRPAPRTWTWKAINDGLYYGARYSVKALLALSRELNLRSPQSGPGNVKSYSWSEINTALLALGYSPKRCVAALFAL